MAEKYFKCDPKELCNGSACCRTLETRPSLGVGDYIRLSEYTGEPVVEIWRKKGNINLTHFKDMGKGGFVTTLSLIHDPCPYLSEDSTCDVYEVRPLCCADFPLNLLIDQREKLKNYEGYKCLDGVQPSPKQTEQWKKLTQIMEREAELDCRFFWLKRPSVYIPTIGAYFQLVEQAAHLQIARDPGAKNERSKRLLEASREMRRLYEMGKVQKGLQADFYVSLITPVLFPVIEDQVAERLASLDGKVLELYKETSEEWKKLAKEME